MIIEKKQNTYFKADIIHNHGAKKRMILNIEQYWQKLNTMPEDSFGTKSAKVYCEKIMNNKSFNAKRFYNKIIKNFKEETKDFDFTLMVKNNDKKPNTIELKTNDGKIYKAAEVRNFPLWLFADDLFRSNTLYTKVQTLLAYNEKGSSIEKAFNKFWCNKIAEERTAIL